MDSTQRRVSADVRRTLDRASQVAGTALAIHTHDGDGEQEAVAKCGSCAEACASRSGSRSRSKDNARARASARRPPDRAFRFRRRRFGLAIRRRPLFPQSFVAQAAAHLPQRCQPEFPKQIVKPIFLGFL